MYFNEIIGHNDLKSRIQKSLNEDKLAHAYIFEGIAGVGKSMTARALGAALLCETSKSEPCGQCPACLKMLSFNHPDYEVIAPDGSSIKNKQIEEFQEFILLRPFLGSKKIAVIQDAHSMTASAQNRILKILEEPPHYAVIVFITDQLAGLLPTIQSRCQTVSFQRLSKDDVVSYIREKHNLDDNTAAMYATFADGSIKRADDSIADTEFVQLRDQVIGLIDNLIQKKTSRAFDWVSEFESQKEKLDSVLSLMKLWFRDIMFVKLGTEEELLFNADHVQGIKKQSYRVTLQNVMKILERIENAKMQLRSHVNVGLLLESLILDIQEGI